MGLKIEIKIEDGEADTLFEGQRMSIDELNMALAQLELMKMNVLNKIIKETTLNRNI